MFNNVRDRIREILTNWKQKLLLPPRFLFSFLNDLLATDQTRSIERGSPLAEFSRSPRKAKFR